MQIWDVFSPNFFSFFPLSFYSSQSMNVWSFVVFSQVLGVPVIFWSLFSLCCSDWLISVLSLVHRVFPLYPPFCCARTLSFYVSYCIFQFRNFHYILLFFDEPCYVFVVSRLFVVACWISYNATLKSFSGNSDIVCFTLTLVVFFPSSLNSLLLLVWWVTFYWHLDVSAVRRVWILNLFQLVPLTPLP